MQTITSSSKSCLASSSARTPDCARLRSSRTAWPLTLRMERRCRWTSGSGTRSRPRFGGHTFVGPAIWLERRSNGVTRPGIWSSTSLAMDTQT